MYNGIFTVFFTQVGHVTISHKKKPSQVTINNQSGITRQRTNISPRKLHQMMRKNWPVVIINNRKALIKFQESRISKIVSSTMYTAVFVFPHWLLQCARSQTHGHLLGCFFLMSTKRKRRPRVGSSEGNSSIKTPAGMLFHPYAEVFTITIPILETEVNLGVCISCKQAKTRCRFSPGAKVCTRCQTKNLLCVHQEKGLYLCRLHRPT